MNTSKAKTILNFFKTSAQSENMEDITEAIDLALSALQDQQQISILKKALGEMSDYLGENDDCPAAALGNGIWPECNGEAEACGDNRTVGKCWLRYFTEKAEAELTHGDAVEAKK